MSRKRKRSGGKARSKPSRVATVAGAEPAPAPAAPNRSDASRTARPDRLLDNVLLLLAGGGVLLTAYLTLTAWLGAHPAYCGADSGCDLVQSSRWSTLLGVPMALWGLLTYALLMRFVWRLRTRPSAWRMALLVAAVGAGVSWYLTLVSVFAIEATCAWCLTSFVLMNLLLVVLLVRRPAHLPEHRWGKALPAPLASAAIVVLALTLHFGGVFDPAAGPEDPYLKALAVHLGASGARFYGAYWCPHCKDQKALFQSSAGRLPYVECTPDGRGGRIAMSCVENGVRDYPTWVIDGRAHTGLITPKELARLTRFRWDGEPPRETR